ncbi:hypothetical protein P152DRAFT_462639 [Eremomyces bilateralis CBS 781.70]|uniref:F-box domain-containing protein n=1 Tax=Eremomyces bilateralis CBS 781.70 TaxID=1392243 RepID=A0A6G1FRE4_9PEZI|nr:uncharacterized protein P152DRAFT_462639 [Eremomyces bilateralis CBS 781.70]KAF1808364.1 hypothetical protein P152DRAFT_462639 [Eremomyces bilateralis CBS 781.70]
MNQATEIMAFKEFIDYGLSRRSLIPKQPLANSLAITPKPASVPPPTPIEAQRADPPLLRLPTELRREILRYLIPHHTRKLRLYSDIDSSIIHWKSSRGSRAASDSRALAVFRTNRLLYWECLSVLYSENHFHFIGFSYRPMLEFVRKLSPNTQTLIRHMRITRLTDDETEIRRDQHDLFCRMLHDFLPGLISLRADPWIWM